MLSTPRSKRAALAIALLIFWTGIIIWLCRGGSPAIIGGVLLALNLIAPLCVLLMPVRQHDPAMSAARGCLAAIILALLMTVALLAIGVSLHHRGLVWTAFGISMMPVAGVTIGGAVYVVGLVINR